MSILNIALTAEQVFPPEGKAILMGIRPNKLYSADGQPKGEDGIKVIVAAPPAWEKVTVRIPGSQSPITAAELEQANASGKLIWVGFKKLRARLWQNYSTKDIRISATAEKIVLLEGEDDAVVLD